MSSDQGIKLVIPTGRGGRAAYPRQFAVAPLFAVAKRGKERELASWDKIEVPMAVESPVRVLRSGLGLTSDHQDVLLAVFRIFAGLEANFDPKKNKEERLYVNVKFAAKDVLTLLGKGYGQDNRTWLRDKLDEISRAHITMMPVDAKAKSWPLFSGFILQLRTTEKPQKGQRCSVSIPIEFAQVFERQGYGQIDLEQRKGLGSSQLAKLLQVEIECLKDRRTGKHFSYRVETWKAITGSKATLPNFTKDLRNALKRLQSVGVVEVFTIEKGKVHLTLPNARPISIAKSAAAPRREKFDGGDDGEFPAFDEMLANLDTADPFYLELFSNQDLQAMLDIYAKSAKGHERLPAVLKTMRTKLSGFSV